MRQPLRLQSWDTSKEVFPIETVTVKDSTQETMVHMAVVTQIPEKVMEARTTKKDTKKKQKRLDHMRRHARRVAKNSKIKCEKEQECGTKIHLGTCTPRGKHPFELKTGKRSSLELLS